MSDYLADREIADLGYEPTRKGWAPLEAAEEHRQTGLTLKQWQRFSFVMTRGWVALPESGIKTFALATCLGKMMNKDGTFDRVRNVGDAMCVIVRAGFGIGSSNSWGSQTPVTGTGGGTWPSGFESAWPIAARANPAEPSPCSLNLRTPVHSVTLRTSHTRTSGHLIPA